MKFGIKIDYKHTCKLSMKTVLQINNYKQVNGGFIWQIH